MIKVGILGAGRITNSHRQAYEELRADGVDVKIVAVADIRPEFTEKFRDTERVYGDYKELLEAEKGQLDYVDICLPTFLHAPAAVMALDMGYNVLCEKPMAINAEAAQQMCDAAKRNDRLLMIAQSRRFRPACDIIKDYIDTEKLGKVKYAHLSNEGGTPDWSWEMWHYTEERSGGALLDLLHDADLIQHFFGLPKAVTCVAHKNWPGSGYDRGTITYIYDNDVYVTSDIDWTSQTFKLGANTKTVVFENGYITYGPYDGKEEFFAVDKAGNETQLPKEGKSSYYREIKYYIECLTEHKPVSFCAPEESRNSVRMVMAACKSADGNGERVTLE